MYCVKRTVHFPTRLDAIMYEDSNLRKCLDKLAELREKHPNEEIVLGIQPLLMDIGED